MVSVSRVRAVCVTAVLVAVVADAQETGPASGVYCLQLQTTDTLALMQLQLNANSTFVLREVTAVQSCEFSGNYTVSTDASGLLNVSSSDCEDWLGDEFEWIGDTVSVFVGGTHYDFSATTPCTLPSLANGPSPGLYCHQVPDKSTPSVLKLFILPDNAFQFSEVYSSTSCDMDGAYTINVNKSTGAFSTTRATCDSTAALTSFTWDATYINTSFRGVTRPLSAISSCTVPTPDSASTAPVTSSTAAPVTTVTSSTAAPVTSGAAPGVSVAVIVGATAGGVVALIVAVLIVVVLRHKARRQPAAAIVLESNDVVLMHPSDTTTKPDWSL